MAYSVSGAGLSFQFVCVCEDRTKPCLPLLPSPAANSTRPGGRLGEQHAAAVSIIIIGPQHGVATWGLRWPRLDPSVSGVQACPSKRQASGRAWSAGVVTPGVEPQRVCEGVLRNASPRCFDSLPVFTAAAEFQTHDVGRAPRGVPQQAPGNAPNKAPQLDRAHVRSTLTLLSLTPQHQGPAARVSMFPLGVQMQSTTRDQRGTRPWALLCLSSGFKQGVGWLLSVRATAQPCTHLSCSGCFVLQEWSGRP